ncbi:MAG: aquaporin [Candidatus Methanomethylophilaceae archaeon]|nr:aquaporin [Candidatus Methanomethylophilaceae archaeon]
MHLREQRRHQRRTLYRSRPDHGAHRGNQPHGTSVNPAKSIGLALFNSDGLGPLWIFIVASIIGGILAWVVWRYVIEGPASDSE